MNCVGVLVQVNTHIIHGCQAMKLASNHGFQLHLVLSANLTSSLFLTCGQMSNRSGGKADLDISQLLLLILLSLYHSIHTSLFTSQF